MNPPDTAARSARVGKLANARAASLTALRGKLGVTGEAAVIGGVNAFVIEFRKMPEVNRDQPLLHINGGGYIWNLGEAGTWTRS